MEIWVILAAAGSGYLVHCWKNFQKSKKASSDKIDDDISGSSSGTFSSRRRYWHLSSSGRRLKTGSNQNCHISQLSDSMGKMTLGCATDPYDSVGDDAERDEAQASQTGVNLNGCRFSKIPIQSQNCQGCAFMSAEVSLDNWHSAQCMGDSSIDGFGSMLRDECPVKLLHGTLDDGLASEERASPHDETSCSCTMLEHGGRSSTNTMKVRSNQKNGSRCFARISKNLGTRWSNTPSERCSSLQFDNTYNQENVCDNTRLSSACPEPFNGLELEEAIISGSLLSIEDNGLLLSPSDGILKVLNNIRKSESLVGEKAVERAHIPCVLSQNKRRGWGKASRERSASPSGHSLLLQGTADNILKALLFHFGVGVGMMFAILSKKDGTERLIEPLEETLHALKALEEDVHSRTELVAQCYQTKGTREDAMAEQISALFNVVSRIIDVVDRVRNSLSQDLACISAMDFKHSKQRAKLEAELEAELERMEMNLNTGDVNELCRRYSGVSEDDLQFGSLIQGELSTRGLSCDTESSEDCADSAYNVLHYGSIAVPPSELAKRLHEVLEARQAREISELEAEVRHLDSRLKAKQEELQVWKQRVLHLLQGGLCESFSSFEQKVVCVKAVETMENLLRADEPCHFSVGMCHTSLDSSYFLGCNEHISSDCAKDVCSFDLRVPQPKTCLTDEADDGNSEQIFGLLSDTATVSLSSSPNGVLYTKENGPRGMLVSCQELESTGFSNEATDDTLDNSPCSVKFVDQQAILNDYLEDGLDQDVGMEASNRKKRSNLDWSGEVVPISTAMSVMQDRAAVSALDVIQISETYEQFRQAVDWSTSDDGSYSSDLDEKLGRLLIKRIVEKSKQGSSIVEVAQFVMASFDVDEMGFK